MIDIDRYAQVSIDMRRTAALLAGCGSLTGRSLHGSVTVTVSLFKFFFFFLFLLFLFFFFSFFLFSFSPFYHMMIARLSG